MPILDGFQRILTIGIGLFARQDNPQLYPFILGALALSVFLGIANLFIEPRRAQRDRDGNIVVRNGRPTYPSLLGVVLGQVFSAAVEFLGIYLIWLAYSTPFGRLPFAPPDNAASWLGLPASTVDLGLAVSAHGLLSLLGAHLLIIAWLVQIHTPNESLIDYSCLFAGIVLVVYGWEIGHWPIGYLIPAELIVNATVGFFFFRFSVAAVVARIASIFIRDPKSREQFQDSVALLARLLAAGSIILAHPISAAWLDLFGMYYTLTLFDSVVASFRGVFLDRYIRADSFSLLATPGRFPITMALVAAIALAGAGGLFAQVSANPFVTATVWIQAGSAALAYALFKPLTTQARWRIMRAAVGKAEQETKNGGDAEPPPIVGQLRWLGFPSFPVFLALMYLYAFAPTNAYGLLTQINVSAVVNVVISFITTTLPRVLPWLSKKISASVLPLFAPAGVFSLILFLITLLIIGIAFALQNAAGMPALQGPGSSDLVRSLLTTSNAGAQELLFLMIAGHVLYLLQIVLVVTRELLRPTFEVFS